MTTRTVRTRLAAYVAASALCAVVLLGLAAAGSPQTLAAQLGVLGLQGATMLMIGHQVTQHLALALAGRAVNHMAHARWLLAIMIGAVFGTVLIDLIGDTIAILIRTHPIATLGLGAGMTTALVLARQSRRLADTIGNAAAVGEIAAERATWKGALAQGPEGPAVRTDMQRNHTAVHEAGHILMFAAVAPVPRSLKASLVANQTHAGRVSARRDDGIATPLETLRWDMHFYLAGMEAEHALGFPVTAADSSDLMRWNEIAHAYLSQQIEGTFYPHPQTELEQRHSATLLNELRANQRALLRRVFRDNAASLMTLATDLEVNNTMDYGAITAHLAGITLPDEFPGIAFWPEPRRVRRHAPIQE